MAGDTQNHGLNLAKERPYPESRHSYQPIGKFALSTQDVLRLMDAFELLVEKMS